MRCTFKTSLAVTLFSMASLLGTTASADTLDKQFDDFFRQQEKFEAEDRKKREEGYVLERFYDPAGKRTGEFSIGGGPDPEPVYGGQTKYNFGGRDFNEPQNGVLNLRLKF
ncbi:MAG: hypothetical protein ACR2OM_04080 [Aestuariivirgaceae bacterium]